MPGKNSREGQTELTVEYTSRPVSGWGGLACFARFMKRLGVDGFLARALPDGRISNNRVGVVEMALQVVATVLMGGSRFEHAERIRGDEIVKRILGVVRFGSGSSLTRYFGNFTPGQSEHLHTTLNSAVHAALENTTDVLDLDSTVFTRYGTQEGSWKGYNPHRRGARSHHPLLAMLAKSKLIVHAWLRAGSASPHRGCCEFLCELLAQLPATFRIAAVRADSGFFSKQFMALLEEQGLPYAIRMKMSEGFRAWCAGRGNWQSVSRDREITEDVYESPKTHIPRRVIILRDVVGRVTEGVLFPIVYYEYHAIVTTLPHDPIAIWRFYNQRGDCENRIKELKYDFNADGFCLHSFHGTEAVFRLICFTFNLVSLFRSAVLHDTKTTLGTIRNKIFVIGASIGSSGRRIILRLGLQGRWREEFDKLLATASSCMDSTAAQLRNLLDLNTDDCPTPWRIRKAQGLRLLPN